MFCILQDINDNAILAGHNTCFKIYNNQLILLLRQQNILIILENASCGFQY